MRSRQVASQLESTKVTHQTGLSVAADSGLAFKFRVKHWAFNAFLGCLMIYVDVCAAVGGVQPFVRLSARKLQAILTVKSLHSFLCNPHELMIMLVRPWENIQRLDPSDLMPPRARLPSLWD